MEMGIVKKIDIDHEMQQSYLDYAMSVIVARALPDARDGLKPVQRRLLFAMYDMGLRPESQYKKSARIVGEVLGKYHPHGDQAVYESMARLAQDFSMRYMLVDGQGNFGSVDGDPPAAMRYTEARITPFALDMLSQLDRNTIDFDRNFDESLEEPSVLPAAIPNLLINGASGIAVGMATNIPPHNLAEVINACQYMLEKWEKLEDISVHELMKFVQGPDFPTGGLILQNHDQNELLTAYATGRGKITVRGRVSLEEMGRGKSRIIINELPYMTNKASLIERIAELTRDGALEGISDLRDESDRQGMRIVIELNKAAVEEKILRELYKKTPLEVTYSINLLALVDGEPRVLTLKQALKVFLEHRIEVVRRRSEFDLQKALDRLHILEGLRIAINALDEIIATIRASQDTDQAKERLMKKFKLSALQSQAILDMPLKRLAALERKKIELEYKETSDRVKELQALLKSPKKMRLEVENELEAIKQKYQDRRRTQIVSLKQGKVAHDMLTVQDVTPAELTWVGLSADGHLFRTAEDQAPRTSGKDAPVLLTRVDTHQTLYLVAASGKCVALAVHTIPAVENITDGVPFNKFTSLDSSDSPVALFGIPGKAQNSAKSVVSISKDGLIKKSAIADLPGPSSQAFVLAKVNDGDALVEVLVSDEDTEYLIATSAGMAIRFKGEEVRSMGLIAAGVNAVKLGKEDRVAGMVDLAGKGELLFISSDGLGWRILPEEFPVQGRYGQGVVVGKLKPGSQLVGVVFGKKNQTFTTFFKKIASKAFRIDVIPAGKRGLVGKPLLELKSLDVAQRVMTTLDATIPVVEKKEKPNTKEDDYRQVSILGDED